MARTHEHSDLRNAERLRDWFGDDLRWVEEWEKWIAWGGERWELGRLRPLALAKETSRRLLGEARARLEEAEMAPADESSSDRLKALNALYAHAARSQSAASIRAMLDLARAEKRLSVRVSALDAATDFLNVRNGAIDLRTGELRPHDRKHLSTQLSSVTFDAAATAPRWEAFLHQSMGGSDELVGYLQRLVGYALTGSTAEQLLVFLYGDGANGKSTFLATIQAMLGDYATQAARGLLFGASGEHPTGLADLYARRFVVCSEVGEDRIFDEALVKDLTGSDAVSARRMREDFWRFSPTHKLFLAGNHKPRVRGDDHGIWRRIALVPWTVRVENPDRDLWGKLRAELPGILAWAVRGCLAWRAAGLQTPSVIAEATAAYREEQDIPGAFLREQCRFTAEGRILRRELRERYEGFCREMGAEPLGARRFAARLRAQGAIDTHVRDKQGVSQNGWKGVRWLTLQERIERGETGQESPS